MYYQLKITLNSTEPVIWRKVLVPDTLTFAQLHGVIQITMGWQDYHMYKFYKGAFYTTDRIEPKEDTDDEFSMFDSSFSKAKIFDANKTTLQDWFKGDKGKINYVYDLGDSWEHQVKLEKINEGYLLYPVCIDGEGSCPPEDCGGVDGYYRLLEILANKKHPEYKETREWLGLSGKEQFEDLYGFDFIETNEILLDAFTETINSITTHLN